MSTFKTPGYRFKIGYNTYIVADISYFVEALSLTDMIHDQRHLLKHSVFDKEPTPLEKESKVLVVNVQNGALSFQIPSVSIEWTSLASPWKPSTLNFQGTYRGSLFEIPDTYLEGISGGMFHSINKGSFYWDGKNTEILKTRLGFLIERIIGASVGWSLPPP
ncbi:MAG: hypothetical protein OEX12_00355 [Gammaproteobacteria bacterium]|nr:hypothetical protein [Gammaproteobacteria bacterium]